MYTKYLPFVSGNLDINVLVRGISNVSCIRRSHSIRYIWNAFCKSFFGVKSGFLNKSRILIMWILCGLSQVQIDYIPNWDLKNQSTMKQSEQLSMLARFSWKYQPITADARCHKTGLKPFLLIVRVCNILRQKIYAMTRN